MLMADFATTSCGHSTIDNPAYYEWTGYAWGERVVVSGTLCNTCADEYQRNYNLLHNAKERMDWLQKGLRPGLTNFNDVLTKKLQDPEFRAAYEALEPIEPRRNWHAFYRHVVRGRDFKHIRYYWRKFIKLECVEKL